MVTSILQHWPQHERYLRVNIGERDDRLLAFSEQLAGIICDLADKTHNGLEGLVKDYRFLCEEIVLPEELHFRRHGSYRLTSFEDAFETVYSDKHFMTRYMNGLLVSDVVWINHCKCMMTYADDFLPDLTKAADLLEIGPGHGLLLYLSDAADNLGSVTAWDISDASLDLAAQTLDVLQAKRPVHFQKRNIFDPEIMGPDCADRFDGVVFSEVLEHLEAPQQALDVLFHICRPGGKVWINVPANSPAPDHLYLVNDASEPADLARSSGFEVVDIAVYPTSGATLERAKKQKLTVNCVITAQKPA